MFGGNHDEMVENIWWWVSANVGSTEGSFCVAQAEFAKLFIILR